MLGQGILETQYIFYHSNFLNSIIGLCIFLDMAVHLQEFGYFLNPFMPEVVIFGICA